MIVEYTNKIIEYIETSGHKINNTTELTNYHFDININKFDFDEEIKNLEKWYKKHNIDFYEKLDTEIDHYSFLTSAMKHKISEIKYFFKDQDNTSRKFIIFSQDCISMIQFLYRNNKAMLIVHMRSSDIISLFSMDMLYLCNMLNEVKKRHGIIAQENVLSVTIGSIHLYD